MAAILNSKGQITIPVEVRNRLHLKSGDRVEFVFRDDHVEMIPIAGSGRGLKGMVPRPAQPLSLEEMDRAIRDAAG